MSGFELRPLTLGELLDRAFLIYRGNSWLFAGIMVIPSCLIIPIRFFLLRDRGVPFPWDKPTSQSHAPAYAFGYLFIYWTVYAVAEAATTYAVADAYLGRSSTIRKAYGKIRGRLWRAIGVTLSVYIRTLVLMFLFAVLGALAGIALAAVMNLGSISTKPIAELIPVGLGLAGFAFGILLSARYTLSLPAVLLEDIRGRAGIRRSVQLSLGRRGQIFVALLLGLLLSYSAVILFEGPFYLVIAVMGIKGQLPNWLILGISVSGTVGAAVASPLLMIALVLCYYDLRIRKEGFDLQHMMTSLPTPDPAVSATLT
jgi:hypothetical protein